MLSGVILTLIFTMDKRERGSNFTKEENEHLINIVHKFKNIIENKKSDIGHWKQKEEAWRDIEGQFNYVSKGIFRSHKALKMKYDGFKRIVRKKSSAQRSALCNGVDRRSSVPLDYLEIKVKEMIAPNVDGSDPSYDCESDTFNSLTSMENVETTMKLQNDISTPPEDLLVPKTELMNDPLPGSSVAVSPEIAEAMETWSLWNPPYLRTPVHLAQHKRKMVTDGRREVLEIQKKIIFEEYEEKKREWLFRECERNEKKKEWEFRELEREEKKNEWAFRERERKVIDETNEINLKALRQNFNKMQSL